MVIIIVNMLAPRKVASSHEHYRFKGALSRLLYAGNFKAQIDIYTLWCSMETVYFKNRNQFVVTLQYSVNSSICD